MSVSRRESQATDASLAERARSVRWVLSQAWATSPAFLSGVVGITLVRSAIPAALAWVAKALIDSLTVEIGTEAGSVSAVLPWLTLGLGLAVLDSAVSAGKTYLTRGLADDMNLRVTTDVLGHAAELDVEYFEDPERQDDLRRARQTTGNRFMALITQTFDTVSSVLQVVSLSAVLVVIQPWTLLAVAVVAPPFLWVRWRLARRHYAIEYNRSLKKRWANYFTGLLIERASVAETRLLGLAPLLIGSFGSLEREFRDQNRAMYGANLRTVLVFAAVSVAAFYGLLMEVTLRALSGAATLGDVAVFFGASARLRASIESGVDSLTGLLQSSLQVSALMAFFASEPRERADGVPLALGATGAIRVEDLHFAYPGTRQPVLRGLSLEARPGETVALVGENGCGKTTLVKLIAGLYQPDRGRILFDGQDVEELDLESLHRQVAFVFQRFGQYEATAADNIAYGDWENLGGDRKRVEEIARRAGLHDMIERLPDGYDTMLGRRFGTADLSGGQWQRLAFARAFAREAPLLILDEPTASLDARSEYDLFERARKLAHGRTTLLISHRFSTVSMADRILVMDEGQIIEQGTHHELLARKGHYAELFELHQRQMHGH